jgi:predicted NAD/FAD-dependent oxidoreductase
MRLSTKRMNKSDPIAVVGAGISGTTVAHLLREQGYQVSLFDKGRRSQYAWAQAHLELEKLEAATLLLEAFRAELGSLPTHTLLEGHRWRYSHPLNSQTPLSLFDRESKVGLCGDWLGGASIGAAYMSGQNLAHQIVQSASSR